MDKNIAAILREDTVTVHVTYGVKAVEDPDSPFLSGKVLTYVTDLKLDVMDLVLVHRQGNLAIARVVKVDKDLMIEPNSETKYEWVAARVNLEPHYKNMERNDIIERTLGQAYQRQMRRSLAQGVLDSLPEAERADLAGLLSPSTQLGAS